jgi:Flp pilus assembly protein TadG
MNHALNRTLTLTLASAWLACCAGGAQAQTAPKAAAPAKRAAAKPAPKAPVEVPLPPAEGEQNAAASMTHFGAYQCEFNQTVDVAMNPKYDGYIDVTYNKQRWTMKPVLSSTGALRLEDVKGQTLMLQIAYKSMLMDVKVGRRLVDECVHEKQAMAKKAAEGQPTAGLMSGEPAPAAAAPAQR